MAFRQRLNATLGLSLPPEVVSPPAYLASGTSIHPLLRSEVSLPRTATLSSDLLAREVFVRPLDDEVADLSGKCGFLLPVTLPPPFTRLKATIVR